MSLLQLPTELFDMIMRTYVWNESMKKTARAREVCRTFNNYISQEMLHKAASIRLATLRDSREYRLYFKQHIAGVLRIKVLRYNAGNCHFLKFLKCVVKDAVVREWPVDAETYEALRSQYARNICDALAGAEYKYTRRLVVDSIVPGTQSRQDLQAVAAAAVGNVQVLLNNVTTMDDMLERPRKHFPSALCAAVAANQTDVVNVILKWVLATVKGPWDTGNWEDMREAAAGLLEALRVAIRTRNDAMASTILQVLTCEKALGESLPPPAGEWLMNDCAQYGNVQVFLPALHYDHENSWPNGEICEELPPYKVEHIFRRASQGWLRRLIDAGSFNVDSTDWTRTMLSIAFRVGRHDLRKVILEAGAHVIGKQRPRKP